MNFQRITMNLVGAKIRHETLDGKDYIVAPTVMLVEGVAPGSQGPLLYTQEDLAKDPILWNHKPIVVQHPTLNGEGISACDPTVVEKQRVGLLFNTAWDGRLKTESWLEKDKLKRVDNRILNSLLEGKSVEVSTGLFLDIERTPGTWNKKDYIGIARNFRPDHLAILPDEKGACSIADGAGLLRNSSKSSSSHELSMEDIKQAICCLLKDDGHSKKGCYCYVESLYKDYAVYCEDFDGDYFKIGYKVRSGKVTLEGEPEMVRKVTSYITANGLVVHEEHQGPLKAPSGGLPEPSEKDLSSVMKHQQMQKALTEHYSGVQQEGDWGGWVTDLYANYVVWSKDGKQFRLPYTYDDDMIRFDGEPEEVQRVSEYRARRDTPIDGTQSPYNVNQGTTTVAAKPAQNVIHQGTSQIIHDATHHDAHEPDSSKGDSQQRTAAGGARKDEVNKMISGGHAKEEDRKFLEDLPDDHFSKVSGWVMKGATQPIVPYSYEGIGDRSSVHSPMPAAHNVLTANQYISQAPPEVRELLQTALITHNSAKKRLVQMIVVNKNNRFSEQWLMTRDMAELQGMAALAGDPRPVNNYGGQADVPMFSQPTFNQDSIPEDDVLPLPVMNFSKE